MGLSAGIGRLGRLTTGFKSGILHYIQKGLERARKVLNGRSQ